jgi:7-keto-8-aminopelargonate synthetase-like enzyme/predicted N-acyltransferase
MEKKTKTGSAIEIINDMINFGREKGVLHLYAEDEFYNGRTIRIKGKDLLHFGSCSYLGLDVDERIREGAIDAIRKYGIHCSSSRTYISSTPHLEYETLMRQLFGAPVILTTTTSLGHHAVIPVVVEEGDAIILDQQVHASIQEAALRMEMRGVPITKIRHSNLEELEAKIIELIVKHDKVWYMIDGIYSMYGDYPPLKEIAELMDKYKQFHLYVDDAHGMSIAGLNGRGTVLNQIGLHKKMVLATSLNKAFAAGGGGVFVFPDEELCKKVMNCGGALIFSGAIANATIGAGIASAKIHLSDEIIIRQNQLKEKLHYTHDLLLKYNLPVVSNRDAPINFVGCGLTKVSINMVRRMINDGFYVNLAMFPAVPDICTGVRFTITLHHTKEDIDKLVAKLAYHLPKALKEEGRTFADLQRAFRKVATFNDFTLNTDEIKTLENGYYIQHETSIEKIDKSLWNKLIGKIGVNDWNQMKFFEQTFSGNIQAEDNWNFHYYIIRDKDNVPVLATYFTVTLAKDDMFSPAAISKQIEQERKDNPYYLTSTIFTMGCMLSIGKHLYIDRSRKDWKDVLSLLLNEAWKEQDRQNAGVLSLRDFDTNDKELQDYFLEQSFIPLDIPDGHIIDKLNWNGKDEYLAQLTTDKRKYIKRKVLEYENRFEIRIVDNATANEIQHFYKLYKNVSEKNKELSVFDVNRKFFENIIKNPNWELIELKLKPEYDSRQLREAVGIVIAYRTGDNYCGLIAGIDYEFAEKNNVYPQTMWQTILRANYHKSKLLFLGYTASQNKRKFGAKVLKNTAYVQIKDSFNSQLISMIANR